MAAVAMHRNSKQHSHIFTLTRLPSEFCALSLHFSVAAMLLGEDWRPLVYHCPAGPFPDCFVCVFFICFNQIILKLLALTSSTLLILYSHA